MSTMLSELANGRDNNFNLIRFVAATLVIVSHSYVLATGDASTEPLSGILGFSLGTVAVDIFFASSGFLICKSLLSRSSVKAFVTSRILRIYPALVVVLLLTTLILGPLITNVEFSNYFSNLETYTYLIKNSILLAGVQHTLPGVFLENPYANAVNGSLWTLPYEVRMYIALAIIAYTLLYLEKKTNLITFKQGILAACVAFIVAALFEADFFSIDGKFFRLASLFFGGAACYVFREKIVLNGGIAGGLAVLAALLLHTKPDVFFFGYILALTYGVLYLAYIPSGSLLRFNELGDYSYGIYVYAFPVQQTLAHSFRDISPNDMIIASIPITILLAYASWHYVEKPALRLKIS